MRWHIQWLICVLTHEMELSVVDPYQRQMRNRYAVLFHTHLSSAFAQPPPSDQRSDENKQSTFAIGKVTS